MPGYVSDSGLQGPSTGTPNRQSLTLNSVVAGRDIVVLILQTASNVRTYTVSDNVNAGNYGSVHSNNPARGVWAFRYKSSASGNLTITAESSGTGAFYAIAFQVDSLDQSASPIVSDFVDSTNVSSHPCSASTAIDTTVSGFALTASVLSASTGTATKAGTWDAGYSGASGQIFAQRWDPTSALTDERGTWTHTSNLRIGTSLIVFFPYSSTITGTGAPSAPAATASGSGGTVVTGSGAPSAPAATALGEQYPTAAFDVVIAFDNGSGALSAAELNASIYGSNWGSWTVVEAIGHTNRVDHTVAKLPWGMVAASQLFDGTQTGGASFDHSADPSDNDRFGVTLTTSPTTMFAAIVLDGDIILQTPANDYNCDLLSFEWGPFAVIQIGQVWNGTKFFRAHCSGANGDDIVLPNGFLILMIAIDLTAGTAEVIGQNLDGSIIGSSVGSFTPGGDITSIFWQDYLRYGLANKTGSVKTKQIGFLEDLSGGVPPVPVPVPVPVEVLLDQTDVDEISLTWSSVVARSRVEVRVNGGSWSTLEADTQDKSVVDDFTDGDSVEFRVTSLLGTQEASDIFGPIVVSNATFALPDDADLIAYWPLDENTGTTSADASGNGHTVTRVNAIWNATLEKFGASCLSHSAASTGNRGASFTAINCGTVHSFSFWIDGWNGSNDGVVIGGLSGHYALYVDGSNLYYSAGDGNFASTGPSSGLTGSHHIVVVRNGTSVTFYVDGVVRGSATTLGSNTALVVDTMLSYQVPPTSDYFVFNGAIDDVRIYDVALTQAQVTALYGYTPGAGTTGTGAATAAVATASGSGTTVVTGSGAPQAAPATGAAAGSPAVTGSGADTAPAATGAAAGAPVVTGHGDPAAAPATADGQGQIGAVTGTGSPSAPAATADGQGTTVVTGQGQPATAPAEAAGQGHGVVTGQGAPAAAPAGSDGSGAPVVTGQGDPQAPAADAEGFGDAPDAVTGTGDATAGPATGQGAGSPAVAGQGGPSAPAATGQGSGSPAVAGQGAPAGPAATGQGIGSPVVSGQAAPVAPAADAVGTDGLGPISGEGQAQTSPATTSGQGAPVLQGSGSGQAPAGQGQGSGQPAIVGQGAPQAPAAGATGSGVPGIMGTGSATTAPADALGFQENPPFENVSARMLAIAERMRDADAEFIKDALAEMVRDAVVGSIMEREIEKGAAETKRVGVDWAKMLRINGAVITSSAWLSVPSGPTLTGPQETDTRATVLVGGGTPGQSYSLVNTITTSDGQTLKNTENGADLVINVQ